MTVAKWSAALAVIALALLTPRSAPADLGLDVSPAKYEMEVPAGQTQTFPITVRNTGGDTVHIQVSLVDFTVGANGQYVFLPPGKNKYSMAPWMSLNPREFDIAPNTLQQVRVSVAVPAGTTGEHSVIAFFQTRPTRKPGGVSFSERIAAKIYELVPNTLQLSGEVDDLSTHATPVGERYLVGFKNTGNAHVYLNGRIEVKQGSNVVERIDLPKQMLVERGGSRIVDVVGKKLAPGSYTAVALIDYGGPNLTGGEKTFTVR
ncbi:MAG TPA: hypothetical protein VNJ51_08265 [Candidatus Dormibacteraeota bacterium]|nr:hypothetical protein [Candidatus Dormibacteraeota bacterium]